MALAAYGSSLRSTGPIFIGIEQGMVKVKMSSKHLDAGEAFSETLRQYGTQPQPIYGRSATPKDKHHSDVARTVQDELEVALCERIGRLAERLSVDNVVVSGGVALNCLAMGRLLKTLQRSVFVPPAPADTGQALGNALWARYAIQSPAHCGLGPPKFPMSPFWGIRPDQDDIATAVALLCEHGMQVTACDCSNQLAKSAARLLSEGKTVATCMGKSEYGPRALGGRSVLADSRNPNSPDRVNLFKCREEFRPFAPSVLNTCISDYFTTSPCSPYMSFAATVRHAATKVIPAVVHKDLSARVHTVTDNSGSPLFSILTHFNALTNVPVLLNTSFNRHGEPIVEKAQDAARAFAESSLDALLLDGFMIERPSLAMR
jgi:carbamoyltransferase